MTKRTTRQIAKPAKKLPSGTTARAIKEWIGKTPNTRPPLQVQLRVLERQNGKCAITGKRFGPKDKKRLDHVKPQEAGGENRESNLQWILDEPHKQKTKAEAATRAKTRAMTVAHAGIKPPSARPMQSRNDLPKTGKPKTAKLPVPRLPTQIERYAIRQAEAESTKKK